MEKASSVLFLLGVERVQPRFLVSSPRSTPSERASGGGGGPRAAGWRRRLAGRRERRRQLARQGSAAAPRLRCAIAKALPEVITLAKRRCPSLSLVASERIVLVACGAAARTAPHGGAGAGAARRSWPTRLRCSPRACRRRGRRRCTTWRLRRGARRGGETSRPRRARRYAVTCGHRRRVRCSSARRGRATCADASDALAKFDPSWLFAAKLRERHQPSRAPPIRYAQCSLSPRCRPQRAHRARGPQRRRTKGSSTATTAAALAER